MTVIGLTGSIASGKSLVADILRENGAMVIDADLVAREVVAPGTYGWEKLRTEFGSKITNSDGTINRRLLGNMVFTSPDLMKKLNNIVHPIIVKEITDKINTFRKEREGPGAVLIIDAPLLIETGIHRLVDEVWLVDIPQDLQVSRLMDRDRLTGEQALARIKSQMPAAEKKNYADIVIDNSRDAQDTRKFLTELWEGRFGKSGVEILENQKK